MSVQAKTGYVAIYRTDDYGGRTLLDENNNLIFEDRKECSNNCEADDNFVAVATVTWKEKA